MGIIRKVLYGLDSQIKSIKDWCGLTFSPLGHTHSTFEITGLQLSKFPNWTNVISLSANTTYVAGSDGFLMVGTEGGNGDRWISTWINGANYIWKGDYSYKYSWGCMQIYLPIRAGVSYSFSVSQSIAFARFVAC